MKEKIRLHKYIFEIRYAALIHFFDRRGLVLEKIWKPFENKMKHWRVEAAAVQIHDLDEKEPQKKIYISHNRSVIAYESPGSEEEFNNDAKKLLKLMLLVFPELHEITRAGYRYMSFYGGPGELSEYYREIKKWLNASLPTSLPINDASIILEHPNGRVVVSSNKSGDEFLEKEFPAYEVEGDYNGCSVDIDSKISNTMIDKPESIIKLFDSVSDVTLMTRDEVTRNIGWD